MARNKVPILVIFLIFIFCLSGVNLPASRKGALPLYQAPDLPFQVGEELHYDISWGFVPAGEGTIRIPDLSQKNGAFHIVTTAWSNAFVDTFYKVRNRIETFLDVNNDCSVGYRKIQHEGTHNRNVNLIFDHANNRVTLMKNGEIKKTLPVPDGIHDPLSAIYYLRTVTDWENDPVLNVTDGNKTYLVRVRILGKEDVETPIGFFKTIKVEPVIEDMEIIFDKKKNGKLYIWLTDDEKKVPVKMKSELAIGAIQALLTGVSINNPSAD